MTADQNRSPLERNPEKLAEYVVELETAIGHSAKVVGILEIGSFANGEGMELSDTDTRVYVTAPDIYIMNVAGHAESERIYSSESGFFDKVFAAYGKKPVVSFNFNDFNEPAWERMWKTLDTHVEFGLSDMRIAEIELKNLDGAPSREHSFLTQGTIIYDPQNFLSEQRAKLNGKIYSTMVEFYRQQFLSGVHWRVEDHLVFDEKALETMKKIQKIQWVKWAVRCVREAVTTKIYMETGHIVHKKDAILEFYKTRIPEHYDFVSMLYRWKTDVVVRTEMIDQCLQDPAEFRKKFEALMPQLEAVIYSVNNTEIQENRINELKRFR